MAPFLRRSNAVKTVSTITKTDGGARFFMAPTGRAWFREFSGGERGGNGGEMVGFEQPLPHS